MQAASALSNCLGDGGAAITAPRVESMGWKSQGEPAQCDFFDIRDDQLVPDEEGMISCRTLKQLKKRLR
jgi:hypothetical protein